MPSLRPSDDPYRTLGILRGADLDEVKAAHRRLAKRFHPDGSMGDEQRFLAVQEAYQLLSDPLRRRDWDRRHAPGPMSARDPAPGRDRPPRAGTPPGSGRTAGDASPTDRPAPDRPAGPRSTPGRRTRTWSAEHVPWWEDFKPRARRDDGTAAAPDIGAAADGPAQKARVSGDGGAAEGADESAAGPGRSNRRSPGSDPGVGDDGPAAFGLDFDVFSRSSGAAWSMAARRHFRRGDEELPSRGAWRYRGTQVVTGAEARKVAAEESAEAAAREATARTPASPEERSPR